MEAYQGLYMHVYNNRNSTSHFPLQTHCNIEHISTSSPIADFFPESTVTLDAELSLLHWCLLCSLA